MGQRQGPRRAGAVVTAIAWAGVTLDCRDTERVAGFWADVLGTEARPAGADRPGWFRIGPVVPGGPVLNFQPVPEAKAGKARLHLDLWVDDLDGAIVRVVQLGGRQLEVVQVLDRGRIAVMADPEGHELCLIAAPAQKSPGVRPHSSSA